MALPLYLYYQAKAGWHDFGRHLAGAWWLIAYLPTIALVSYLGSQRFGGLDMIPYPMDLALVGVIGMAFYVWGVASGWRTPAVEAAHGEIPPIGAAKPPEALDRQ